jgi:hypothetical protein
VELDERESNGIRVTLVWNRETDMASVLVWDERDSQSFAIAVENRDNAYDVFNHPFAYVAFRSRKDRAEGLVEREACLGSRTASGRAA